MNRKSLFASISALALLTPATRADLIFHLPMDDVNLGAGLGGETTQSGPFQVRDIVGGMHGTAAGWDTALTTPAATSTAHITGSLTGLMGQALSFPASTLNNRAVVFGDVLDPGMDSFTVSLWFNSSNISTGVVQMLMSKGNASSSAIGWSIFIDTTSKLYVRVGQSAANRASQGLNPEFISLNQWHHLAMSVDATLGTVTGYLDGTNANWTSGGGGPSGNTFTPFNMNATQPLALGIRNDGAAEYSGGIDDVAFFNHALSASEVNAIYQNGLNGIAVPEPTAALSLIGGIGLQRRRS